MGMFGRDNSVTTTFNAKDNMSPVVRGIRRTMDDFKRDAKQGFGLAAGISVFDTATRAIGDVAGVLMTAAEAAMEDEKSVAQLQTTLRNTVPNWQRYTDAIDDATEQGLALAFADDEVRASLNRLLPYTRDVTEALRLNALAMDLARAKNMSLQDAAAMVGKAYSGQLTALRRAGIAIGDAKDSATALARVQQQVAGQAQAYADTTEGSYKTLQLTIDELVESIGYELLPYIQKFATYVRTDVIPRIDEWTESINDLVEAAKLAAAIVPDFGGIGGSLDKGMSRFRKSIEDTAVVVTGTWGTTMESLGTTTEVAAGEVVGAVRTIPRATAQSVVDMKETIKNGKAGIIEQFRDIAWQSKHPFAQANYEQWLERKQRRAMRKMKEAAKEGKWGVVQQYAAVVSGVEAELAGLPGYAWAIAQQTLANLAGVGLNLFSVFGNDNDGGKGGRKGNKGRKDNRPPKGPSTGTNAMGGFIPEGGTSLVGENGPELITLVGGGGRVTPNHHLGRPIVVNVDGRRLFEIMDARNGRAIAMGG